MTNSVDCKSSSSGNRSNGSLQHRHAVGYLADVRWLRQSGSLHVFLKKPSGFGNPRYIADVVYKDPSKGASQFSETMRAPTFMKPWSQ